MDFERFFKAKSTNGAHFVYQWTNLKEFDSPHLHQKNRSTTRVLGGFRFSSGKLWSKMSQKVIIELSYLRDLVTLKPIKRKSPQHEAEGLFFFRGVLI